MQCQAMLENRHQCGNQAWGFINDIPFCRLHFSMQVASATSVPENTEPLLEIDRPDMYAMIDMKRRQLEGQPQVKQEQQQEQS